MANFRRERVSRGTRPELDEDQLRFFRDGVDMNFFWHDREADWEAIRGEFLADWIQAHPGTRPAAWWRYDAPEPRRRVGGTGDLVPAYAHADNLRFGIFRRSAFVCERLLRAVAPIGDHLVPYDADDPPRYESEAAFLDRHGLLSAAERKALPPDAFEPEVVR